MRGCSTLDMIPSIYLNLANPAFSHLDYTLSSEYTHRFYFVLEDILALVLVPLSGRKVDEFCARPSFHILFFDHLQYASARTQFADPGSSPGRTVGIPVIFCGS